MTTRLTACGAVAATLAAFVLQASAQRPERKQEIAIPGLGISLKAGWQLIYHDGCRFAVPESWSPDAEGGLVVAPDGSNLSIRSLKVSSWITHKAQVRASIGHVSAMHEDGPNRLWLEVDTKEGARHYIDVLSGGTACSALLEFRATMPEADAMAQQIAASIGPGPDRWPEFK